jgi:hypothetical protein
MEASRQRNLPPALREALRALAHEADRSPELFGSDEKVRRLSVGRREDTSNGQGRTPSLSPMLPSNIYRKNLLSFLASSSRFKDKQQIIEFAAKVGFNEPIPAKDSRERVEQRIAAFALMNRDFRENLYKVVPNDWSKQTSGWLELILGRK